MSNKKESIINQLTQKPWEPAQVKIDNLHEGKTFNLHIGKLGLRYIMIVSTIMFCLFIVIGASANLGAVIKFSDAMMFAMAIPNIIGLYLLAPEIRADLKTYWSKVKNKAA